VLSPFLFIAQLTQNSLPTVLTIGVPLLALIGLILAGRAKPKEKIRTPGEIRTIGKYQQLTMWALLAGFTILIPLTPVVNLILYIPVAGFQIWMVYRLTKALESPLAGLRCLLCLVPLASLINLYLVTNQATIILKQRGIRVGVMGASKSELEALV
jgi:hypothetical protein